jgi:hypothetical protein
MGRFFGPTPNIISAEGFFRGSAAPAAQPKTWTTLTTGFEASPDQFVQIFFANSHWLITTTQPGVRITLVTSTDGVHWVQHPVVASATSIETPAAAFGAGVYVVTGSQGGAVPRLSSSPDLGTWTPRTLGFPSNTFLFNPVFGNGVFLLVASGPVTSLYATSANGITWTQQSAYVPVQWGQPIFDGTQFVTPVLNPSGVPKMVTSPDGINWTEAGAVLTLTTPIFVANQGTSQYVIGDVAAPGGDSLNGALTTATPVAFASGDPTAWLAYGAGSDWARCVQINNHVESSSDRLSWVGDTVPAIAATIDNMAWNGVEWIAVGSQTGALNYAMTRGA